MRSACRASPPIDWAFNGMRGCPPQMQSPATNSQGFTGLPLAVASFRHVTVTRAGLSLPASESGCRKFSSIGVLSIHDYTLHSGIPAGIPVTRLASRPLPRAAVSRLGIILKHRIEGGRCPSASGTPATRGAHNSETSVQQPDHQTLAENPS